MAPVRKPDGVVSPPAFHLTGNDNKMLHALVLRRFEACKLTPLMSIMQMLLQELDGPYEQREHLQDRKTQLVRTTNISYFSDTYEDLCLNTATI